jgi:hypothetical protein
MLNSFTNYFQGLSTIRNTRDTTSQRLSNATSDSTGHFYQEQSPVPNGNSSDTSSAAAAEQLQREYRV